jgi:hypothetical protein
MELENDIPSWMRRTRLKRAQHKEWVYYGEGKKRIFDGEVETARVLGQTFMQT